MMTINNGRICPGTLYGVGVGPGNPEWMTLEAVRILGATRHIFAPRARIKQASLALEIARPHLAPGVVVHEHVFPMSKSSQILEEAWLQAACAVLLVLEKGDDVCFLTIGDCMLYSTFLYLRRALLSIAPNAKIKSIPGIPAFVAAASQAGVSLGEGRQPLVVVPASGDLELVDWALLRGGTTVIMKVGERLDAVQQRIEDGGATGRAVLASRVGLEQECVVPLSQANMLDEKGAYLSLILVEAAPDARLDLKEAP